MEIQIVKGVQALDSVFLDVFSVLFSYLSSYFGFILIFLIFLLFINKKYSFNMLLIYLFSVGFNFVLKLIINRKRPYEVDLEVINKLSALGSSYPSGHALSATLLCFFVLFFIFKKFDKTSIKVLSIILSVLFIICVGFSRIYLGQHFLSDIVTGILLGLFCCSLSLLCYNKFNKRVL